MNKPKELTPQQAKATMVAFDFTTWKEEIFGDSEWGEDFDWDAEV